ncbi:laccase domain-containing protein [Helicobacter sp. MIT 11-5569]|uniref:polyphenol oxidase family protein n=1 Tax=Helicobacter sp. MIT 11-5569 TaxID=1548151 RepID=UPI00068B9DD1|nr:polyphenol oxidase family protein [Helicobacter sp. MIT 11-5569]TLD84018.1 laccase domain-containing protein [Helicobacter sp. MIT 11-5569]
MQTPPSNIEKTQIHTPNGICAFLSHYPNNIAFHAGKDSKDTILKNRSTLISPFHLSNLAYLNQIHGNIILNAKNGGFLGDGDGILITQKGIIGMIMVADCNPILLFDSKQKILMLLHGGRVGLQKGILHNALDLLQKDFHTNLQNLFIYIGPSIRACCYEVQNDVFSDSTLDCGKIIRNGKIYLDLIAVIRAQLESYNLTNHTIAPQCTCCNKTFFSYRRDCNCGRFALFAYLV